jgi:hypothetical protein
MGKTASLANIGSIADSSLGFRNRIINGAMGISQRTAVNTNVAVGTGTAGTFGPDRFTGYSGTASLWNILQVTTGVYDFPNALRLQRIAAQTSTSAIYLRQIIETNNCVDLAGQSVTISFYATAGANYSGGAVTIQVLTGTAADQGTTSLNTAAWTGLATPINSTFTPTITRTRFTFTGTIGASVQEIAFGLNWSGSGTAGANDYLDITGVQLEKGSTATSFDYRPYGTELALCQRYFVGTGYGNMAICTTSTTNWNMAHTFPVAMRTAPSFYAYTGTYGTTNAMTDAYSQDYIINSASGAINNSGTTGARTSGWITNNAGAAGRIAMWNNSTAVVQFSAEL